MTPGWLAAMARRFTPAGHRRTRSTSTAPVALVNEALARFFANRSPLGQTIQLSVRFGGFDELPMAR
jgi:hypothetical protein